MAENWRNSGNWRSATTWQGVTAGGTTQETTASLTVDLTLTASASVVKATTADLAITPATTAAATADKATTASLAVAPATAAEAAREQSTTASLTVTPTTAAEATAWRLTANDGSGATDVSGTWSSEANAWDDSASTYATATGVGTHTIDITGYDFASVLGASDTLVSVSVNVAQYVSDGGRFSVPTIQPYVGATPIGSPVAVAERTTAGSEDITLTGLTVADLRDSGFKLRFVVEQTS